MARGKIEGSLRVITDLTLEIWPEQKNLLWEENIHLRELEISELWRKLKDDAGKTTLMRAYIGIIIR